MISHYDYSVEFWNRFDYFRRKKGYTLIFCALNLGINEGNFYKNHRKRTLPIVYTIVNMAHLLNCDVRDLIDHSRPLP